MKKETYKSTVLIHILTMWSYVHRILLNVKRVFDIELMIFNTLIQIIKN